MYRHYSFDLWETLIKPNPVFKEKRAGYFHQYLLDRGTVATSDEIQTTFTEVWKYFDQHSLLFGEAPNPLEMYAMVIFRLTGSLKGLRPLDMELMYQEVEKLFLENPPSLYDEDTKAVLLELQLRGKTLSLLSNTSFIRGKTLEKILEKLGIRHHFMFQLYSDEIGYSKPHRECFTIVHRRLPYDKGEILHVGDNELADFIGAREYGFDSMIINSNTFTIKDLLNE